MTKQAVETYKQDPMIVESFPKFSHEVKNYFGIPSDVNNVLHIEYSAVLTLRGMVLIQAKEWYEAEKVLQKALNLRQVLQNRESIYTAQSMALLGIVKYRNGHERKGKKLLKKAIKTIEKVNSEHHYLAFIYLGYSEILRERKKVEKASRFAKQSIDIIETCCGSSIHPLVVSAHKLLFDLRLSQNNMTSAQRHQAKVHEICTELIKRESKYCSESGLNLSRITYIQKWQEMMNSCRF